MTTEKAYSLSYDSVQFGIIQLSLPILSTPVRKMDKLSWGHFSFEEISVQITGWTAKKKLKQATEILLSSFNIENPEDFYLVVANSAIDPTKALESASACKKYCETAVSMGVDLREVYPYPDKPNSDSSETIEQFHMLLSMRENCPEIDFSQLSSIIPSSSELLFPVDENIPEIRMMSFMAYFISFLSSLKNIKTLHSRLELPAQLFPGLIEAFTLPYTPSPTRNHNPHEKVGDAALGLLVTATLITDMIQHPTRYLNNRVNRAVSNELFSAIAIEWKFSGCLIGRNDEEKVYADCFEAIAGQIYLSQKFDGLRSFWKRGLHCLSNEYLRQKELVKPVEVMKLGFTVNLQQIKPASTVPPVIAEALKGLVLPPQEVFDEDNDFKLKCKMVGAGFIKEVVVTDIASWMKSTDDMKLASAKLSRDSVDKAASTLGVGLGKDLKSVIGGLYLHNGFDATREFVVLHVLPSL